MPAPCSIDLRQRAVQAYESGEGTFDELSNRFGIHPASLFRWVSRKRETGDVAPLTPGGGNPIRVNSNVLSKIVAKQPDGTSFEICSQYNREVGRKGRVHRSSILRALHRQGLVFKKNGIVQKNKIDPTLNVKEQSF